MFKKWVFLLLCIALVGSVFLSGCGSSKNGLVEGKVNVVTSFYPLYDFAVKIGGEHAHVINLLPAGVDPHDWEPKTRDMANITNADLLVYNGLGFEGWIDNFLASLSADSNLVRIEASHGIETISSEEEGHEEEGHEEEGHEEEGHEEEGHEEEEHGHGGLDPHVWISPLQAMILAENIKDAFIQVDAVHKADYEANYAKLFTQLQDLHHKFEEVISNSARKDIVVSHQAYGYLARDYGLNQIAVMGITPESEPTPQNLKLITDYVHEHDVKYILFEELVSPKLAKSLAADTGIETLVFNPLEGLTDEQVKNNEDYFSVMEKNLTSLKKALQ